MCGGGAAMSHGGGGAPVTGGAGGGVLQHRGRRQWCDTAKRIGEGGVAQLTKDGG
jgi:hypothetical protein